MKKLIIIIMTGTLFAQGISDPSAIKFTNERIRKAAVGLASLYATCKIVTTLFDAQPDIQKAIPNDSTPIADGAVTDGRPKIIGSQVYDILDLCRNEVSRMEANTNANLNKIIRVAPIDQLF